MERILLDALLDIESTVEKRKNTEPLKKKRGPRIIKKQAERIAVSYDIASRMNSLIGGRYSSCKLYFEIKQFPGVILRVVKVAPSKETAGALIIEATMYTIDPLTVEVDMHHKFQFYFM